LGINPKSFINKPKNGTMKKILFVLALGAFAACNDSGSGSDAKKDTGNAMQAAPADTTHKDTSMNKMAPADTTHKDTTVKK